MAPGLLQTIASIRKAAMDQAAQAQGQSLDPNTGDLSGQAYSAGYPNTGTTATGAGPAIDREVATQKILADIQKEKANTAKKLAQHVASLKQLHQQNADLAPPVAQQPRNNTLLENLAPALGALLLHFAGASDQNAVGAANAARDSFTQQNQLVADRANAVSMAQYQAKKNSLTAAEQNAAMDVTSDQNDIAGVEKRLSAAETQIGKYGVEELKQQAKLEIAKMTVQQKRDYANQKTPAERFNQYLAINGDTPENRIKANEIAYAPEILQLAKAHEQEALAVYRESITIPTVNKIWSEANKIDMDAKEKESMANFIDKKIATWDQESAAKIAQGWAHLQVLEYNANTARQKATDANSKEKLGREYIINQRKSIEALQATYQEAIRTAGAAWNKGTIDDETYKKMLSDAQNQIKLLGAQLPIIAPDESQTPSAQPPAELSGPVNSGAGGSQVPNWRARQ